MHEQDKPRDLITVIEYLRRGGQLDAVGGEPYVLSLARKSCGNENLSEYLAILQADMESRELVRVGLELMNLELSPQERIEVAVASGGRFLKWKAPKAAGVLLIDGEMPAAALQERIAKTIEASDTEPAAPLDIVTPDLNRDTQMPGRERSRQYPELSARDIPHKFPMTGNAAGIQP